MAPNRSGAIHLVIGDEELLVARGVSAAAAAARAEDPDVDVSEHVAADMTGGDLLAAVSPSLFGGYSVVIIRDVQDARKDLAAALLDYAAAPDPDVVLVLSHAGGAKGKALADGLRSAGAICHQCGPAHPAPRAGRVRARGGAASGRSLPRGRR